MTGYAWHSKILLESAGLLARQESCPSRIHLGSQERQMGDPCRATLTLEYECLFIVSIGQENAILEKKVGYAFLLF
ncbi:MAG: hypothetical protein EBT91_10800 [Rhodobacteraceae bacterium]|jgi:hypothetical protein|nr:hypothetical protein [Paracoccaceae bacterium]